MALNPSFLISPTANAGVYTFTDSSTGSDVNVVTFKITLNLVSGTALKSSSTGYAAGVSLDITLAKDYALNAVAQWLDAAGNQLYGTSQIYAFTQFGEAYFYSLIQSISSSPPQTVLNDTVFFGNFMKLRALLDSAPLAISVAADLAGAQNIILLYQLLLQNTNLYF